MSIRISLSNLTDEIKNKIDKDLTLTVSISKSQGMIQTQHLNPYRVEHNTVFIPFSYGKHSGYEPMTHRKNTEKFVFKGVLRDEQKIVRNEAIEILNRTGSIILSTHVGFGKSILGVYFAYKIQMKTLIIVNRLTLMNQWKDVLKQFIENPKIYVMKPGETVDWGMDFFIVNAINIPKFGYMPEFGLVIVDEVHLIVSKILSTCFQYLTPSYLIGLSATPYRQDGLDILLDLYFGKEKIDRQLQRKHYVFKIDTGFTPIIKKTAQNRIDWNDILTQQSQDEHRNDLIVEIISKALDDKFLVLCKRVEQIKILEEKLKSVGIHDIEALYGSKQPTSEKRVLLGTPQKLGVGFDAKWLTCLIVASDLEAYFIQYMGRVFRRKDTIPKIYDLVDNNNILRKHYKTREQTYLKHGGIIRKDSSCLK